MASAARVLMPLPDRGFDVTETAVPFKRLTDAGFDVVFTTERGDAAACDPLLIEGLGKKLRAGDEAISLYREMERSPGFAAPIAWADVEPADYAGCWIPGGHAQGMKQLLEGEVFFEKLRAFWALDDGQRPIAAVCHGVLVPARAGLLDGVRSSGLPSYMEWSAYLLTFWKIGKHYRTYPEYVEAEVRRLSGEYVRGPLNLFGSRAEKHAFVCEDGRYLSARWPGDVALLADRFVERLNAYAHGGVAPDARASA